MTGVCGVTGFIMTAALDVMLMIAVALLDTVRGDTVSDYGAQNMDRSLPSAPGIMSTPGMHHMKTYLAVLI